MANKILVRKKVVIDEGFKKEFDNSVIISSDNMYIKTEATTHDSHVIIPDVEAVNTLITLNTTGHKPVDEIKFTDGQDANTLNGSDSTHTGATQKYVDTQNGTIKQDIANIKAQPHIDFKVMNANRSEGGIGAPNHGASTALIATNDDQVSVEFRESDGSTSGIGMYDIKGDGVKKFALLRNGKFVAFDDLHKGGKAGAEILVENKDWTWDGHGSIPALYTLIDDDSYGKIKFADNTEMIFVVEINSTSKTQRFVLSGMYTNASYDNRIGGLELDPQGGGTSYTKTFREDPHYKHTDLTTVKFTDGKNAGELDGSQPILTGATKKYADDIKAISDGNTGKINHNTQLITAKADKTLANVDNADFKNKATAAGVTGGSSGPAVDITPLARKDLTNIDDTVFQTKGVNAGLAKDDLTNVSIANFKKKADSANVGSGFKGTYPTLVAATANVSNPKDGFLVLIGAKQPYTAYVYNEGTSSWNKIGLSESDLISIAKIDLSNVDNTIFKNKAWTAEATPRTVGLGSAEVNPNSYNNADRRIMTEARTLEKIKEPAVSTEIIKASTNAEFKAKADASGVTSGVETRLNAIEPKVTLNSEGVEEFYDLKSEVLTINDITDQDTHPITGQSWRDTGYSIELNISSVSKADFAVGNKIVMVDDIGGGKFGYVRANYNDHVAVPQTVIVNGVKANISVEINPDKVSITGLLPTQRTYWVSHSHPVRLDHWKDIKLGAGTVDQTARNGVASLQRSKQNKLQKTLTLVFDDGSSSVVLVG